MSEALGAEQINVFRQGGVPEEDIQKWREERATVFRDGGVPQEKIDEYFGIKNPDMSKVKSFIDENIQGVPEQAPTSASAQGLPGEAPKEPQVEAESTQPKEPPKEPKVAKDWLEALDAGLQMSVSGLFMNRQMPTTVMPEHADMAMRIAAQVSQLAGDIPAMAAGMAAGGSFGAGVGTGLAGPVGTAVGATVGAGAGGFAFPSAMRQALIESYQKGDIRDFSDFWERTSAIVIEGLKGAAVGAATAGSGQVVGKLVGNTVAPAIKTTAQLMSEVATMTTVGKALEGEVPNFEDFVDGAILVGGFHAVGTSPIKHSGFTKLRV